VSLIQYTLQLTRGAQDDLRQIYATVAETRSRQAADELMDELIAQAILLQTLPERGSRARELIALGKDKYRQILHGPYRIFYRVEQSEVIIVAVLDGRRDIVVILKRRILIL
jgi:toxin ParE1/3/4